jgi:hypothetical protein
MRLVFDCETNGLLPVLDRIHSLVIRDVDTGEVTSCCNATGYTSIEEGLNLLSKADTLIGHNIINFDIRALGKVHPDFRIKDDCVLYDTLIISRVLAPELEQVDDKKYTHIESKYRGKHSLAAWGERLGVQKIKFVEESKAKLPESADPWDSWSEAMQAYCEGDTLVSLALYEYFLTQDLDPRCQELEHEFACIMTMMETFGFPFNDSTISSRRYFRLLLKRESPLKQVNLLKTKSLYLIPRRVNKQLNVYKSVTLRLQET